MSAKWLELLKEIAPSVKHVAVLAGGTANPGAAGQLAPIQAAASSFGVDITVIDVSAKDKIERGIMAFANSPNAGLVVTRISQNIEAHDLIVGLASRYRLPTVYPLRSFVVDGGLVSYGPDSAEESRQAAGYVDRILKGEKAADLPVQAPTKFEMAINLKAAKELGINVPPSLLARADQVIE